MHKGKVNDYIKGNKMKKLIKFTVSIIGLILFFTNVSLGKKQFVPIVADDLLSMATYYTTNNNLQIPILDSANEYRDLVVQCENDITYFIMAHRYYDASLVTASRGSVVIDENTTITNSAGEDTSYLKGHIEGNESIAITGRVYFNNEFYGEITRTCNSNIDNSAYPAIPNYPTGANSYGILELNCKDDIVYYTLSYACFRTTVKLSVVAEGKPTTVFQDSKQGSGQVPDAFIYYQFGYYERGGSTNAVEVVGTITGGNGGGPYSASCP